MHFFSVIIQPFILIALGFLLSRLRMFPRSLWEGVEKLVYYVLFPPLLFNSVARAELTVSQTSLYLAMRVLPRRHLNVKHQGQGYLILCPITPDGLFYRE
jgi:predicted permease